MPKSFRDAFIALSSVVYLLGFSVGAQSQADVVPGDFYYEADNLPSLASIVARSPTDRAVYGLYAWHWEVGYEPFRKGYADIGIASLRLSGPLWEQTQWMDSCSGDQAFSHLARSGLEVMFTVQIEETSTSATPGQGRGESTTSQFTGRADYVSDEEFLSAYRANIAAVLNRYGPDGSFWSAHPDLPRWPLLNIELWNEPNFGYMWPQGSDPQRQALYARILSNCYPYIKQNWPTVRVVGFGAGGDAAADKGFIAGALAASLSPPPRECFDVLSTHPYVDRNPPDAHRNDWIDYSIAQSLDEIRLSLGSFDKPIWYTEVGWPISQADGGEFAMPAHVTLTRLFQAAYVTRIYAWALRLGVDRVHLMFTKDSDSYNGGIFNSDGSYREAAHAIRTMSRLMPHPKLMGAISDNVDGYCAYRFRSRATDPSSGQIIMAWNGSGKKTVSIPLPPGRYVQISMLGLEQPRNCTTGLLSLEIGPYPVYIKSASVGSIPAPSRLRLLK